MFAGFGNSVLSDIPLTLMAGEWITLCTIPVTGTAMFTIVIDEFTATINGDYYVSLGGQESQGDIIEFNTLPFGRASFARAPLQNQRVRARAVSSLHLLSPVFGSRRDQRVGPQLVRASTLVRSASQTSGMSLDARAREWDRLALDQECRRNSIQKYHARAGSIL